MNESSSDPRKDQSVVNQNSISTKSTFSNKGKENEKEKSTQPVKIASLSQVFGMAEPYDIFLMVMGTAGGLGTGTAMPVFNVLFGKMLDNLNGSGTSFQDQINKLCIIFIYIAVASLLAGFLQVYCWSAAGERQTQKFRMKYVRAILSQEIGWFDTCGAAELSTQVAELTGKVIRVLHRCSSFSFRRFSSFP
jgi:ATP-binding cassette subfamily B (MDR/TAP) protein 1